MTFSSFNTPILVEAAKLGRIDRAPEIGAVVCAGNLTPQLIDLESGRTLKKLIGNNGMVEAMAITPDGSRSMSSSRDFSLRVWDLENGRLIGTFIQHTAPIRAPTLTPDGRFVVSASADATLQVWDLQSGRNIADFTGESSMLGCCVSEDGRVIIAAELSGQVHFLRLVEADNTKPPIGETKIQLLHPQKPATDS
jgi:WD40 repeat protein